MRRETLRLQLPDAFQFLLGQQFRFDVGNAGFASHHLSCAAAIASEHDPVLDIELVQPFGSLDNAFTQTVAQQDASRQIVAIGNKNCSRAQAVGRIQDFLYAGNPSLAEKIRIAGADPSTRHRTFDAATGHHMRARGV